MNTIKAILDKSDFEIYGNFLNCKIDDQFLDELLDKIAPGNSLKGLIPTLSFKMETDAENEIVWDRITPQKGEKRICPILMCPDDLNFSCTLVTVEINNTGTTYTWKNFGFDRTKDLYKNPQHVGRTVEFIQNAGSFTFEAQQYNQFVKDFQDQFLKEMKEWNEANPKSACTAPW